MKHASFFIFLATLSTLPFYAHPTHSDAETLSVNLNNPKAALKTAPQYIKTQKLTGKERKLALAEAKKWQSKYLKTFTEEDLRQAANTALSLEWNHEALTYLKKLEKVTKNTTIAQAVKLEIADINFGQGNLKTAATLYDEYASLYPGDKERAAYAQYKGILSNFYCMLENDRDQTKTLKTIALADSFLESKSTLFKKYAPDVMAIKNRCYTQLYEHDLNVFNFYFKRSSYKAADTRLASMKVKLLPYLPNVESNLLECEYKVAVAQKDTPRALKVTQELETRFPSTAATRMAEKTKPVTNYVNRF